MENMLFKDVANKWLKSKTNIKESTLDRYKRAIESKLLLEFGELSINCITANNIQKFFNKLSMKYKSTTIKLIFYVLKSVIISVTKKTILKPQLLTLERYRPETLNKEEVSKLNIYFNNDSSLYSLGIRIALTTGLRVGEICALKWKNINLEKKTIKIIATMQRMSSKIGKEKHKTVVKITAPKTESSYREIPIPPKLFNILKIYKCHSDCFLLTGKSDKFIEPRVLQYHFQVVSLRYIGRKIRFHALRHTFATELISHQVDIKTVSELMGHSSVIVTLNIYRFVKYDDMMKALKIMEKIL